MPMRADMRLLTDRPPLCRYTLVPSNPGQAFRNWADSLVNQGMRVFGDQADWLLKFATRSILHRDIDDPGAPAPSSARPRMLPFCATQPSGMCSERAEASLRQ